MLSSSLDYRSCRESTNVIYKFSVQILSWKFKAQMLCASLVYRFYREGLKHKCYLQVSCTNLIVQVYCADVSVQV